MLPSLGQWIARPGEVPKGKFLKGISSSPGGLRTVAMAARGGWLWPVPSPPGAPSGVMGVLGGYSSAGAGQSHQSDIRQQWRLFFILWAPAVTFVAVNLWLICVKWQSRRTGNSLGISGQCSIEFWLSHWTLRTFWTNCLTSLLLFSFAFFHLQMKIPIS